MDNRYNDIPKNWNKFIEETRVNHNLIIKRKEGAICTNCKHEFQTKKKIGEYQKCPNCKNTYLIKSSRLRKFWFTDTLILLDKIKDDLVFRYFELWSAYDNKTMHYGFIFHSLAQFLHRYAFHEEPKAAVGHCEQQQNNYNHGRSPCRNSLEYPHQSGKDENRNQSLFDYGQTLNPECFNGQTPQYERHCYCEGQLDHPTPQFIFRQTLGLFQFLISFY